ncbi:MAG: AAA family ATPase, partial [Myxococcota bacterium]
QPSGSGSGDSGVPADSAPAPAASESAAEQDGAGPRRATTEPGSGEIALYGRDDIMARAQASLRAVHSDGNPGLFTVYGGSGMGKSRLARELVAMVGRESPDTQIITLRANRQLAGVADRALGDLLEHVTGQQAADGGEMTSDRALGDAIRHCALSRPMAIVIDDAHFAVGPLLDAIEYAALDGHNMRLWIALTAQPDLRRRRPQWGDRAHRHDAVELGPLDESAAIELAGKLLHPAEYPPADVLHRLAKWTAGSPHALDELIRTLKREGIVRKRPQSDSWYVATAELDRLPPSPAAQWLAARRLDIMSVELAACLRLCAVLGAEFLRDELEWVQNAAEHSGSAGSSMDTDIGLAELAAQGFLERRGDGVWAFLQTAQQDAVYKTIGARERRAVHGHALDFWHGKADSDDSDRVLAALARHAGAAGKDDEAAAAYLALGDRARAGHRAVEADSHYTAALSYIAEDNHARRAHALGGRGRMRYRIQRNRESLADLRAAQDHARALGDRDGLCELILEEATALDWAWMHDEAAQLVDGISEQISDQLPVRLQARFLNARARCHFRKEQSAEAVELYTRATELARACGDDETRIIGLLVFVSALLSEGRVAEAEMRSNEVIRLCKRTGDKLHLCAAYSNRVLLNSMKKLPQGTVADLRRAVKLARQVGQPILERVAAHNLAEFLHWSG